MTDRLSELRGVHVGDLAARLGLRVEGRGVRPCSISSVKKAGPGLIHVRVRYWIGD